MLLFLLIIMSILYLNSHFKGCKNLFFRVFVGGISASTTEQDLLELFSQYGMVKATKIISDRAGVSKGYGFVTFETEEEARRLTQEVTICEG